MVHSSHLGEHGYFSFLYNFLTTFHLDFNFQISIKLLKNPHIFLGLCPLNALKLSGVNANICHHL